MVVGVQSPAGGNEPAVGGVGSVTRFTPLTRPVTSYVYSTIAKDSLRGVTVIAILD